MNTPADRDRKHHERRPVLKSFAEIAPAPVSWLWEPYVPRRRITILEGDPGVGKTYVACKLAATVSSGEAFPWTPRSTRPARAASVLYMTAEDGLADTLRPRLERCGADLARVHTLTGWQNSASSGTVTLRDLDVLEQAFAEIRPALLVIDPLQAFLGRDVDMNRANHVRPVFAALGALAERHEAAVLMIRHLTKTASTRASYRGMGSIDFAAAVRSQLLAGRDSETGEHAVVHVKASSGELGPAIGYQIDGAGLAWTGLSEVTAVRILKAAKSEEEGPRERAKAFLREALAPGPRASREVHEAARRAGIAERTLARAVEELGVQSTARTRRGKRGADAWFMSLPSDANGSAGNVNPRA